jgi:hypothetical protein
VSDFLIIRTAEDRLAWLGAIARESGFTVAPLRVAIIYAENTDLATGITYRAIEYIATDIGLDRSSVVRANKQLLDAGFLRVHTQGGGRGKEKATRYWVTLPADKPAHECTGLGEKPAHKTDARVHPEIRGTELNRCTSAPVSKSTRKGRGRWGRQTEADAAYLAHKRQEEWERRKHSMNGHDYSLAGEGEAGAPRARPAVPNKAEKLNGSREP